MVKDEVSDEYLSELFDSLNLTKEKLALKKFDPLEHKDKTRSTIAIFFVRWFFYLIAFSLIFVMVYNSWVASAQGVEFINPKDLILVITGAIGTPLGFVVGYYFKGAEEK